MNGPSASPAQHPLTSRDVLAMLATLSSDDAAVLGDIIERSPALASIFERLARSTTAYHELAERYRAVIDTASDAIVITDPQRRIAFANPAAERLFGYDIVRLVGMPVAALVPADAQEEIARREQHALAGEPQRYETTVVRADGERRIVAVATAPMRDVGQITGIVASLRDVSAEHAARAEAARSEARYLRLVESAADGIFTVDREGRFTSVNRVLANSLGLERAALMGMCCTDVVQEADRPVLWRAFERTIAGDRQRVELRYRDPDGNVRQASLTTTPIEEYGAVIGGLGIIRDITEERALTAQLLQREKLAALGQLVSGVAHELNNPLAGIDAFSQILLAGAAGEAERREAVITIQQEARRAAKIVSNLLLYARQRPPERGLTDLNDVVRRAIQLRRYALRTAGITVEEDLDASLPPTWADAIQLQQVLLNLITNAEHAVAQQAMESRRIVVRTGHDEGRLTVEVKDSGPGISASSVSRIFDPFFTTKPVGEGTGLGLSISDGIVREHDGVIRVRPDRNSGASFIIELPLVEPLPAEPIDTNPVPPRQRLLIVDDEQSIRSAIAIYLRREGHEVDVAGTGGEALALMGSAHYDGVLLDVRLPDMSGIEVHRVIAERSATQAERVVLMTGESEDGVDPVAGRPTLRKPFSLAAVTALLCGGTR